MPSDDIIQGSKRFRSTHLYGKGHFVFKGVSLNINETNTLILSEKISYPVSALDCNSRTHQLFATILDRRSVIEVEREVKVSALGQHYTVELGQAKRRPCIPGEEWQELLVTEWFQFDFQNSFASRVHISNPGTFRDHKCLNLMIGVGTSSSNLNTTYSCGRENSSFSLGDLNLLELSHGPSTNGSSGLVGTVDMHETSMTYLVNTMPLLPFDAVVIDCIWQYPAQVKQVDSTLTPSGVSSAAVYFKMLSMRRGGQVHCIIFQSLSPVIDLGRIPTADEIDDGLGSTAAGWGLSTVDQQTQAGHENYFGIPLRNLAASLQVMYVWCYDAKNRDEVWPSLISGMNVTMPELVTTFKVRPTFLWAGGGRFQIEIVNGATVNTRKVRFEADPDECGNKPYDFFGNVDVNVATNLSAELTVPDGQLLGYPCYYETYDSFGIPMLTAPAIIFAASPPGWAADPSTSASFDPAVSTVIYWGVQSTFYVTNGNNNGQPQMVSLLNYTVYKDENDQSCGQRALDSASITLTRPASNIVINGAVVTGLAENVVLNQPLGVYAVCYLGDATEATSDNNPTFAPLVPLRVWIGGPMSTSNYWHQFAQTFTDIDLSGKALDETNTISFLKEQGLITPSCGNIGSNHVTYQSESVPRDGGDTLRTGIVVRAPGAYRYCWFNRFIGTVDVWGAYGNHSFNVSTGVINSFRIRGHYPQVGVLDEAVSSISRSGIVVVGYRETCGDRLGTWHQAVTARSRPLLPDEVTADGSSGTVSKLSFSSLFFSLPGIYRLCWNPDASIADYARFNSSVAVIRVGGPLTGFTWTVLGSQDVTISVTGWAVPETARIILVDVDFPCGSGPMVNTVTWPGAGWDNPPNMRLQPENNVSLDVLASAAPFGRPDLKRITFPTFNAYMFPGSFKIYQVCYSPSAVGRQSDFSLFRLKIGTIEVSTVVECGDGLTSSPQEECDDGQRPPRGGDGCDDTCHIEPGWEVAPLTGGETNTAIVKLRAICGDAKLVGYEWLPGNCDDGDRGNFDGCDENCKVERGYECQGEPSECSTKCGDGVVLGEDCDDGNTFSGDGCSGVCRIEPNWSCNHTDIGPDGPSTCAEKPKPPAGACAGSAVAPNGQYVCDFTVQPDSSLPLICEQQPPCGVLLTDEILSVDRRRVVGCPLSELASLGTSGPVYFCYEPSPPSLVSAAFQPSARQIQITFDSSVTTFLRAPEAPCGSLFNSSFLPLLGDDPGCSISSSGFQLDIFLGRGASVIPRTAMSLKKGSIGLDMAATAEVPLNISTANMKLIPLTFSSFVVVRPSQGFTPSVIVIEAVNSWNPCAGGLRIDAVKGTSLLDGNSAITWSCDVSPMGPQHAAYVTEWLRRDRKSPFRLQFQVDSVLMTTPPPIGWIPPGSSDSITVEQRREMVDRMVSLQLKGEAEYCFTVNVTSRAFSEQRLETICVPTLAGGSSPPLRVTDAPSGPVAVSSSLKSSVGVGVDLGTALSTGGEDGGLPSELQRQCAKFTTSLLVYRWRLFTGGGITEIPDVYWKSLFETKNPNSIRVPPYTLIPGKYQWTVEAYYETGTQVSIVQIPFELVHSYPVTLLDGLGREAYPSTPPFPEVSAACPIVLDASKSTFPEISELLNQGYVSIDQWDFVWTCTSSANCPSGSFGKIGNGSVLEISPSSLVNREQLSITLQAIAIVTWKTDLIGDPLGKTFLLQSKLPVTTNMKLTPVPLPKVNVISPPPRVAAFNSTVELSAEIDPLSFSSERGCNISSQGLYDYGLFWEIDGQATSAQPLLQTAEVSPVVSFRVVRKGGSYSIRLITRASFSNSSAVVGSWKMRTTRPPFGGSIVIDKGDSVVGDALTTTFVASAVEWVTSDPEIQLPLSFEISAKRIGPYFAPVQTQSNDTSNSTVTNITSSNDTLPQTNVTEILSRPGRVTIVHSFAVAGPTARFVLGEGVWVLLLKVKDASGVRADGGWPLVSSLDDAISVRKATLSAAETATLMQGFTATSGNSFELISKVGQVSDALSDMEAAGVDDVTGFSTQALSVLTGARAAMSLNIENPEASIDLVKGATDVLKTISAPGSLLAADGNVRASGIETLSNLVELDQAELGNREEFFEIVTNLADSNSEPEQLRGLRQITDTISDQLVAKVDRKDPVPVTVISRGLGVAAGLKRGVKFRLLGTDFTPPGQLRKQNRRALRDLQEEEEVIVAQVWKVSPYFDLGREEYRDGAVVVMKNIPSGPPVPINLLLPGDASDISSGNDRDVVTCVHWEGDIANSSDIDTRPSLERRWGGWSQGKCHAYSSTSEVISCECLSEAFQGVGPFRGLSRFVRYSPVVRLPPTRPDWTIFQAAFFSWSVGSCIACLVLFLVVAHLWTRFLPVSVQESRLLRFLLQKSENQSRGLWAPWSLPRFPLWASLRIGQSGGIFTALSWAFVRFGVPVVDRQHGSDFRRWSIQLLRLAWVNEDKTSYKCYIFQVARALYMWHRVSGRFGPGTENDNLFMLPAPLTLTKPRRHMQIRKQRRKTHLLRRFSTGSMVMSKMGSSSSFGSLPPVPAAVAPGGLAADGRWDVDDEVPPLLAEYVAWAWVSEAGTDSLVLGRIIATTRGVAFVPDPDFDYYQEDMDMGDEGQKAPAWKHPTALLELPYESALAADPVKQFMGNVLKQEIKEGRRSITADASQVLQHLSPSGHRKSISDNYNFSPPAGQQAVEESPPMLVLYFDKQMMEAVVKRESPEQFTTYNSAKGVCDGIYPSQARDKSFPGFLDRTDVPDNLGTEPNSLWVNSPDGLGMPDSVKRQVKNSLNRNIRRKQALDTGGTRFALVPDMRLLPPDIESETIAIESLASRQNDDTGLAVILLDSWEDTTSLLAAIVEGKRRAFVNPQEGYWVLPPVDEDGGPVTLSRMNSQVSRVSRAPSVISVVSNIVDVQLDGANLPSFPKAFDLVHEGSKKRAILSKLGLMIHPTIGQSSLSAGSPVNMADVSPSGGGHPSNRLLPPSPVHAAPDDLPSLNSPQNRSAHSPSFAASRFHMNSSPFNNDDDIASVKSAYTVKSSVHELIRSQSYVSAYGTEGLFITSANITYLHEITDDEGAFGLQITYHTLNTDEPDREVEVFFEDEKSRDYMKNMLLESKNGPVGVSVVGPQPPPFELKRILTTDKVEIPINIEDSSELRRSSISSDQTGSVLALSVDEKNIEMTSVSGEELVGMNKYFQQQVRDYVIQEGSLNPMQTFFSAFVRLHPLASHIRGIPEYAIGAAVVFVSVHFIAAIPIMIRPACVYGGLIELWRDYELNYVLAVDRALSSILSPTCGWWPTGTLDSYSSLALGDAILPFVTEVRPWFRFIVAFLVSMFILPFLYRKVLQRRGASRLIMWLTCVSCYISIPSLSMFIFAASYSWVDVSAWLVYFGFACILSWILWPLMRASTARWFMGFARFQTKVDWVLQVFPDAVPDPTDVENVPHPTVREIKRYLRFLLFTEVRTGLAELIQNLNTYGGVADNAQTQSAYDAGMKLMERQQAREYQRFGHADLFSEAELAGERISDFLHFADLYHLPHEMKEALLADSSGKTELRRVSKISSHSFISAEEDPLHRASHRGSVASASGSRPHTDFESVIPSEGIQAGDEQFFGYGNNASTSL